MSVESARSYRQLARDLHDEVLSVADHTQKKLVQGWVRAWDDVRTDLERAVYAQLRAAEEGIMEAGALIRAAQVQKSLDTMSDRLVVALEDAGATITDDTRKALTTAARNHRELIRAGTRTSAGASFIQGASAHQLDSIFSRSSQQITSLLWPLQITATDAMKSELVRSVAIGNNPRTAAARMVKRVEGRFNGGLSRALVIARTEMLDAAREAQAHVEMMNADVLEGWVWMATLEGRTCVACLKMHGTVHEVSEPGPYGHQQCRCARAPLTKSWEDLGFEGVENVYEEGMPMDGDGVAWFEDQSEAVQRDIMGRKRFEAWEDGTFADNLWAYRKSTNGWRDSYHVGWPSDWSQRVTRRGGSTAAWQATMPPHDPAMMDLYAQTETGGRHGWARRNRNLYASQGPAEAEVAEFVQRFTASRGDIRQLREELADGAWPSVADLFTRPMKVPTEGGKLWRGTGAKAGSTRESWIMGLAEGDSMQFLDPMSFADNEGSSEAWLNGDTALQIILEDAHGIPVDSISVNSGEKEWMVGGWGEIVGIEDDLLVRSGMSPDFLTRIVRVLWKGVGRP